MKCSSRQRRIRVSAWPPWRRNKPQTAGRNSRSFGGLAGVAGMRRGEATGIASSWRQEFLGWRHLGTAVPAAGIQHKGVIVS